MLIWILALVLLASLAGLGLKQGAIRVSFSLVGLLIAALLCVPVGGLLKPLFLKIVPNPVLAWVLGPLLVFCLVLMAFKIAGLMVHRKVEVYYKYKAGDLRLALWERVNARVGLCLGLVNGLVYLVLISWVIYAFSYWTVQIADAEGNPWHVRTFNRLGKDLHGTGLARGAAAADGMPDAFYQSADLAGLVYHHPLLEARLSRYPGFLGLAQRPDFEALGADAGFADLRLKQRPYAELLANPSFAGIARNKDTVLLVWKTASPDLKDLDAFLRTGHSATYDSEEILGRWYFDLSSAMGAYRREKPTMPSSEVLKVRQWMAPRFARTMLVAAPDHSALLKNMPSLKPQAAGTPPEAQTLQGQWKKEGGDYYFVADGQERKLTIKGSRMAFRADGWTVALLKED